MWKKHDKAVQSQFVEVELRTAQETLRHVPEAEINHQLCHEIATELFKRNLIEVSSEMSAMDHSMKVRARLNVVEPSIQTAVISDFWYEVAGHKFSHEQIEYAVKNQLPEYFL